MITKISRIKNLAVFQNFDWDRCVLDSVGGVVSFTAINVLYGRNYSGKTTLSRIIRAIETGTISDKYDCPEFVVAFDDGSTITQNNLSTHSQTIRVFNEDFVRDNLRCINNPEDSIVPFSVVVGDDNNKIELTIKALELEIGSKVVGKETGLYADLKRAEQTQTSMSTEYGNALNVLDKRLSDKATDRIIGIKYRADKFGDINYTKAKLENDIQTVVAATYKPIDRNRQSELEQVINEQAKATIPELKTVNMSMSQFAIQARKLIERKIGGSDKITELIRNTVLNDWVKKGCELHKDKRETCAFCGSKITDTRWAALDKHFDEESKELEDAITLLAQNICAQKAAIRSGFGVDKNLFYSKYNSEIDELVTIYETTSEKYVNQLDALIKQLEKRAQTITISFEFEQPQDYSDELTGIWKSYEALRIKSNEYTESLSAEQTKAKKLLRLNEVANFAISIGYIDAIQNITTLREKADVAGTKKDAIQTTIRSKEGEIKDNKRKLNDEEKGAAKVNEYLNNFFGNGFLSLQAIKNEGTDDKQIRFEIIRDGKKAYHLSGGECSLIAFCYFMAKLDDVNTRGTNPIIWIDDPVSSLDGNHIFFVYSLIAAEVTEKTAFEQLFISTHNLDFLKYLKRINGKYSDSDKACPKAYFIITRQDSASTIKLMPKYMKEYVTEFNYLFHEIYKCSCIETVDDTNFTVFYNFGNNARKFLEIYLFYKYPDNTEDRVKMERFFGEGKIPVMFIERINNEYSHLKGDIERASMPVEVPEMLTVAKLIISKIKEDKAQYLALMNSIGVNVPSETD
jgi:wobble nucleotide-excising tRNase